MSNPISRARWLAPALLLALAGCGARHTESRLAAHQAQVDPPALWRVEALDGAGRPMAALQVCADRTMREGFARATAEVAGRPCLLMKDRVEQDGLFAVRCELDGRRFGLTVNRSGDPERDFQVAFALKALDGTAAGARQVRRFRRVGPCPGGWGIGDQARVGERRGVNALAGVWSGE
ncbi:MAG: hypothetical protein EPO51_01055 [Phenylobacterium sp.]|uniref:hypothetical protein n=1 Tax=Phenylobacterium sp. TaxID=1871053 RepID=UPI0011FAEE59|nr:hypothetical protein [Phenylobacterium sp.]TAJ74674.1 MAG: hypothetical protein EPO51_01055 [Phenylobacterium sp.]